MEPVDNSADVKLSLQYHKHQRGNILRRMIHRIMKYNNFERTTDGPTFSDSIIQAGLEKRFLLPIYSKHADAGLYHNFAEFKNATPSVKAVRFTYKNGKVEDVLDQNDKKIDITTYWGLSDGKKNYLFFRGEPTELIPCDRSFKIRSFRTVKELIGEAEIDITKRVGKVKSFSGPGKIGEYFDLNMDTGKLFLEEMFGTTIMQKRLTN
jgi:hypothetical protein